MVNIMATGPIPPASSHSQPPTKGHHVNGHFSLGMALSPLNWPLVTCLEDLHGVCPYFVYPDDEELIVGGANASRNETCIVMNPLLRRQEEVLCRAQQNQRLKRIKSTGPEALAAMAPSADRAPAPQPVSLPEFAKFDSFISEVLMRTAGANGRRREEGTVGGAGREVVTRANGDVARPGGEGTVPPPRRRLGKLHYLITLIEERVDGAQERRQLRQLLLDSQPRHSKWYDPNRPGQAELYDELERVLIQLKAFTVWQWTLSSCH